MPAHRPALPRLRSSRGPRIGPVGGTVARGRGTAQSKVEAMRKAGVDLAEFPTDIARLIKG